MNHPIPDEALDDRLAIVGTAGSGKTYLTIGTMARLLKRGSRVIGVDALGVMWGLRLMPDGKTPSPYDVVIFGGQHGDLPLNEHAGALIGETVATMRESCIIDLSEIGTKAGERRFMLAFLTALYRHANKEPVHLIVDEADMWAPQRLLDKDGEAAKLLGMMETIVRRGRIKGFIPWLVTQRPAVLSKDVLSQADSLVALKLTAKQDHDAVGGWIEATADKSEWQAIKATLATKQRGQGVLWIPARGVLDAVTFPPNETYDSSRTPKRGEKRPSATLKTLDLGKLKERLAKVETETKANDPKALKAEIARLTRELAVKPASVTVEKINTEEIERAYAAGHKDGHAVGFRDGWNHCKEGARIDFGDMPDAVASSAPFRTSPQFHAGVKGQSVDMPTALIRQKSEKPKPATGDIPTGARALLDIAVHRWPAKFTWTQLCTMNGTKARGGHFNTMRKILVGEGLVSEDGGVAWPTDRAFALIGIERLRAASAEELRQTWLACLPGPADKMLAQLIQISPIRAVTPEELGVSLGMAPRGGHWNTGMRILRDNDLIEVTSAGIRAAAHLWTDHSA